MNFHNLTVGKYFGKRYLPHTFQASRARGLPTFFDVAQNTTATFAF